MHTLLGSDPTDPSFCPEPTSTESLGLLTATVDEEIERVFVDLPDDDAGRRPDPRARRGGARAAAPAARTSAAPGRVIRVPRRLPPRPDALGRRRLGDPRLRGRAGALAARAPPEAQPAARRRRDAPLVRVRGVGGGSCCATREPRPTGKSARATSSSRATASTVDRDARPVRRGDGQAPQGVRAREGGVRAALRAEQPARLGAHPGRSASCACSRRRCRSDGAPARSASSTSGWRARAGTRSCGRSSARIRSRRACASPSGRRTRST